MANEENDYDRKINSTRYEAIVEKVIEVSVILLERENWRFEWRFSWGNQDRISSDVTGTFSERWKRISLCDPNKLNKLKFKLSTLRVSKTIIPLNLLYWTLWRAWMSHTTTRWYRTRCLWALLGRSQRRSRSGRLCSWRSSERQSMRNFLKLQANRKISRATLS